MEEVEVVCMFPGRDMGAEKSAKTDTIAKIDVIQNFYKSLAHQQLPVKHITLILL